MAPDTGTLSYLPKLTSNSSLLHELVYTARPFNASTAHDLGLVSRVVKGGRDEVVKEALGLAKVIASKSPVATEMAKRILTHARDHSVKDSLEFTAFANVAALRTDVSLPFAFSYSKLMETQDIGVALNSTIKKQSAKFNALSSPMPLSKL